MELGTGIIMREIESSNASLYLRETRRVSSGACVTVRELSGGVSNIVLLVEPEGSPAFVIKQCRERLRVAMDWRARLDRIWFETTALEMLAAILPDGVVPRILFIDEPNYLFAMTRAPEDSMTWKAQLLAGLVDVAIAARLGEILAEIHTRAIGHPALDGRLADATLFDELRVDPYYRTIARAHPEIKTRIEGLIREMSVTHPTLVLGDYSPKNILVHRTGLVLLDFECAHAGDPAFDLGFFLSHLMLKAARAWERGQSRDHTPRLLEAAAAFWRAYQRGTEVDDDFSPRVARHTAACMLARVDGKSPVEYLEARGKQAVRSFALKELKGAPTGWDEMSGRLARVLLEGDSWRGS